MEKLLILCFALCFLAVFVQSIRHGDMSMCPRFSVKKNMIIRTKDSKARGARMLAKQDVDSARECFLLCCERDNCGVGIMRYSHVDDEESDQERVVRKCYMFDCKEPSVCTFVNHTGYAVIELHRTEVEQPKQEEPSEKCPPGVPVAMCAGDPCETYTCPRFPDAKCKPSFCGGCKAIFSQDGRTVNCGGSDPKQDTAGDDPRPTKSAIVEKTTGAVNEEEVEINPEEAGPAPTEDPNNGDDEDPHAVHEWRHYLTDPSERRQFPTTLPRPADASNAPLLPTEDSTSGSPKVYIKEVKYLEGSATSVPLLVALIACIIVLVAVIWRLRCSGRGKLNKKFAVDDGDYLINGMYL